METVNPEVPSTIEAAALCKMAERGQITGALLDGHLVLDNAIDLQAAQIKNSFAGSRQSRYFVSARFRGGQYVGKKFDLYGGCGCRWYCARRASAIVLTSRAIRSPRAWLPCGSGVNGRSKNKALQVEHTA